MATNVGSVKRLNVSPLLWTNVKNSVMPREQNNKSQSHLSFSLSLSSFLSYTYTHLHTHTHSDGHTHYHLDAHTHVLTHSLTLILSPFNAHRSLKLRDFTVVAKTTY